MLSRVLTATVFAATFALPCAAQQRAGLMGELIKDLDDVEKKFVGLATAVPTDKYAWRPATGVRSINEVLLHVAADNYVLPAAVGVAPDPATGIDVNDFKTVTTFEMQKMSRDAMLSAIDKSFDHLRKAMSETPDGKLDDKVKFFGQEMTVRQVWVLTGMHLHEHLGQLIAYARSNGVIPPWAKPA